MGMFQDIDRVIEQVSRDKGIPKQFLIEAIEAAFLSAARKKWGHLGDLEAQYNQENGEIELFQFKQVVEDITDPHTQMTMDEAHKLDPDAQMGDSIGVKMDPSMFGRIAAQAAKQVIIQKVRDAERSIIYDEYKDRLGEIVTGIVRRFEKGDFIIDLGRTEAVLPRREQVRGEEYRAGERLQGLFLRLEREGRGPQIVLSRRSNDLVRALFEMEVPEIAEGIVEIKAVAREPGVRSKIAVHSNDHDVDPVGACVGIKGSRVQSVVAELKGEKIDIVSWDQDPARFVCNAIAPAEVTKVIIREREHAMEVVVPDDQLSLAIGRRGQNVRLAAQLTGWNIDVYSETKIELMAGRMRKVLAEMLSIDDSTAMILYSHSYRMFEDIANAPKDDLLQVPGIGAENLLSYQQRAKQLIAEGRATQAALDALARADEERRRQEDESRHAGDAEASAVAAIEQAQTSDQLEQSTDNEAEAEAETETETETK